jgi:hypothetical protein
VADRVVGRLHGPPGARTAAPQIGAAREGAQIHRSPEEGQASEGQAEGQGAEGKAAAGNDPVPPGTEVWVHRSLGYHHAGVYIGNGEVVQVAGEPLDVARGLAEGGEVTVSIQRAPLSAFLKGGSVQPGPNAPAFPGSTVIERALSQVGQAWRYNPLTHNCQHFSSWAVSGASVSAEAEEFQGIVRNLARRAGNAVEGAAHEAEGAVEGAAHRAEDAVGGAVEKGRNFLGGVASRIFG